MRKIILGMAMVAVASSAFAQTIYEQKTYVFTGLPDGSNIIEDADAQKECERGIKWLADRQFYGINPNYFLKVKVYAVDIIQRNGRMDQERGPEVGEMLICQDWQSYAIAGTNHVPIYYEVTIGGTRFRIIGGGTSPFFPNEEFLPGGGGTKSPANYPESGVANLSYTGTVLTSTDGGRGGMFYTGNTGFLDGVPREYYDHSGISVLQVLIPQQ
ncbi:hypothetical protein [Pseudohalioglobus lutimaris]|uniref:Uncharacterized protein n=1 Tax=Pseudohalioglobus lutimaris TaxID=1737061 RepID=A0A2N5WYK9_9GAMM|nr:hypothetical protein [Pseudohalioglobus lutimaris]PLW67335.1 hypothetical protein C0039_17245 [Pseudohalioglobus lutimaris]